MSVLDWIFPPRCAGCRALGSAWCAACSDTLVPVFGEWRPGVPLIAAGRLCGPWQRAIHEFKYLPRPQLAQPLGRALGAAAGAGSLNLGALAPVPLHPDRHRERGFNQSERIARAIAPLLGCRVVLGLQRVRATVPQVGLHEGARRANLSGAFRWDGPPPDGPLGLVDDVCTTGATLEAAAAALARAGLRVGAVLVLAVRTGSPLSPPQTLAGTAVTWPR